MKNSLLVPLLFAIGCSQANEQPPPVKPKPAPQAQPVVLEDGVYPVVVPGAKDTVELDNVPVPGSGEPTTKLHVRAKPVMTFDEVASFDFTFKNNECTSIGFANTKSLREYTRGHPGSKLAVVINNMVVSCHKIREAIEHEKVQITCCTEGGGDHLHRHLTAMKQAAEERGNR